MKLDPQFDDLSSAQTFIKHIEELINVSEPTPHAEILTRLLNQLEPLDFEVLAFPEIEKMKKQLQNLKADSAQAKEIIKQLDKLKLTLKHYLILSIEHVLKMAEENRWGLCKNHDFIYLYNDTFWANIDKDEFQKFLGEASEKMGVARFTARYYQFRDQLFKQFLATAYLPTPAPPENLVLINLRNGTFEVTPEGTKLRPFDREDFLTYQLPFDYNPDAKAPIFQRFLDEVLPDKQRQMILAEYLGFVFIKNGNNALKEEKSLILFGTGANGKSVFYEVVRALLGSDP